MKKTNVLDCDNLKDDAAVFQKSMDREFLQRVLLLAYPFVLHDHIVQLVPGPLSYYLKLIELQKKE